MKNLKGHVLSDDDQMIVVKSFPGATADCMKDYIKPTIKKKPNAIVIHTGTNDLKHEKMLVRLQKKLFS